MTLFIRWVSGWRRQRNRFILFICVAVPLRLFLWVYTRDSGIDIVIITTVSAHRSMYHTHRFIWIYWQIYILGKLPLCHSFYFAYTNAHTCIYCTSKKKIRKNREGERTIKTATITDKNTNNVDIYAHMRRWNHSMSTEYATVCCDLFGILDASTNHNNSNIHFATVDSETSIEKMTWCHTISFSGLTHAPL